MPTCRIERWLDTESGAVLYIEATDEDADWGGGGAFFK